jgi:hypothetical protein
MTGRYDTTGNPEGEYYPGTSVLVNLEGIRNPEEISESETKLHLAAYEEMFVSFDEQFTPELEPIKVARAGDVCHPRGPFCSVSVSDLGVKNRRPPPDVTDGRT